MNIKDAPTKRSSPGRKNGKKRIGAKISRPLNSKEKAELYSLSAIQLCSTKVIFVWAHHILPARLFYAVKYILQSQPAYYPYKTHAEHGLQCRIQSHN